MTHAIEVTTGRAYPSPDGTQEYITTLTCTPVGLKHLAALAELVATNREPAEHGETIDGVYWRLEVRLADPCDSADCRPPAHNRKGRPPGSGLLSPKERTVRQAKRERLGAWVRNQRIALDWTQLQLAEATGRTRGLVSLWEAGTSAPSAIDVETIGRLVAEYRSQG